MPKSTPDKQTDNHASSPPRSSDMRRVVSAQQQLLAQHCGIAWLSGVIRAGQLQLRMSAPVRELLGFAATAHVVGGPLFNQHVPASEQARLRAACAQLINHNQPMALLFEVQHAALTRHLQVCVQRVSPSDARVVGMLREVTAHVHSLQTMQVTQERLQSVSRLTLLGEVASGLAHELNQPLAAITTFAQAGERLLNLPEPRIEKAQQVFREVSQQALRAGEIIRQMRSLIKRHAAQREVVSCALLMRDFLALAEPMARALQVQLLTHIEPRHCTVNVDVVQLHQVMMILYQNALEATRYHLTSSGGVVTVALSSHPAGIEWSVQDQGPGVSAEVAAQLFQPFFSTKPNGTGLGLISSRNILESYGARLQFANQPQGGCRFYFVLPVHWQG